MFHRLGVDPTKSRPASEALLRRVLQGKGLPLIHPAVDVCNLASLEHQLPLGLYDRAHVKGPIYARVGRAGEGYEGIRRGRVNLTGRVLLADDDGAFGAPTADSARTQLTAGTRAVLAVIYCPTERPSEHLSAMLARRRPVVSTAGPPFTWSDTAVVPACAARNARFHNRSRLQGGPRLTLATRSASLCARFPDRPDARAAAPGRSPA
jgi:DNA/RNA-binding domain of Phe-tRNA-synthetase-like protein